MTVPPTIVLLAHGSPDARHAAGVEELADGVRRAAPGQRVHPAYLDHHPPRPTDLELDGQQVVVVPVLVTPAFHARVDVPATVAELRATGVDAVAAPPLGPHSLLLDGCAELLGASGFSPAPTTAVLVALGGSSDGSAAQGVADTIAAGRPAGWGEWGVAALDGGEEVASVAARLRRTHDAVVGVTLFVAEGVLRDRVVARCEDAGVPVARRALSGTSALASLTRLRARES